MVQDLIYAIKASISTFSSLSKLPWSITREHIVPISVQEDTVVDFLQEVSCLSLSLVLGGSSVAAPALEPFFRL